MSTFGKIHALLTPAERRAALVLFGLMVIGMLLETLGIGLVVPAITLMLQSDLAVHYPKIQPLFDWLGNPTQAQMLSMAMLGLVGIYLIKNMFLAFLAWRQTHFAFGVQMQLSQRLFTTYLRQPYTFHLQRNSAQLMRNVTGEVGMFTGAITNSLSIITESLVLIGIASLLLLVEPLGALIVVLVLGTFAGGFNLITRKRILRWGKARQYHDGLRIQHLQQGLGGAKDVKLLGRESDFLAQYQTHNIQSARVAEFQTTLQQIPRLWLELLAVAGLAILVQTMLSQGRDMSSIVPTLSLFAAAAFRLMPSVNRVLASAQALRYARIVINTLYEESKLDVAQGEVPRNKSSGNTPAFQNEICLSNLNYSYPNATSSALDDLSITVRKGESVGFIGPSGSGKSTLIDVILGLLTPSSGQVAVDGQDIQNNLRAWQDQIGYVPQTIYLTDDTLRRNIAFGLADDQIDDESVIRAVRDAQLEEFVASQADGLQTMVGERGIRLSGGQRQRIGIARALYHDPSLLVLDEATSALDTEIETDVMQAVAALHGRKTILIVAHRLSTVEQCDRLYRLDHGKLVAEGAPLEILKQKKAASSARSA
ncbi:MAG TPA: ABC transporter ATP-binding protein [Methylophilaceae bacterium]|jgi:ABC-type multidrug transport system fused ATPase/permease subunit